MHTHRRNKLDTNERVVAYRTFLHQFSNDKSVNMANKVPRPQFNPVFNRSPVKMQKVPGCCKCGHVHMAF